jgi:hypothetical protein
MYLDFINLFPLCVVLHKLMDLPWIYIFLQLHPHHPFNLSRGCVGWDRGVRSPCNLGLLLGNESGTLEVVKLYCTCRTSDGLFVFVSENVDIIRSFKFIREAT